MFRRVKKERESVIGEGAFKQNSSTLKIGAGSFLDPETMV